MGMQAKGHKVATPKAPEAPKVTAAQLREKVNAALTADTAAVAAWLAATNTAAEANRRWADASGACNAFCGKPQGFNWAARGKADSWAGKLVAAVPELSEMKPARFSQVVRLLAFCDTVCVGEHAPKNAAERSDRCAKREVAKGLVKAGASRGGRPGGAPADKPAAASGPATGSPGSDAPSAPAPVATSTKPGIPTLGEIEAALATLNRCNQEQLFNKLDVIRGLAIRGLERALPGYQQAWINKVRERFPAPVAPALVKKPDAPKVVAN